ncbi:MAG TPA: efflux RND transporter periplasmic adaptor subunit, partial [Candidatus Thermoplasmatota archaeon]
MKLPTLPGRYWIVLTLAMAGVGAAALLFGAEGDSAVPQVAEATVSVTIRPVTRLDRPEYVALSGDVEGWSTAHVGFMVPGRVARVGPREGDAVGAGDLLAELEPRDYELNLEIAAAQRERAEDEHRRAVALLQQNGIAENDFHKAEIALRLARAQEEMAAKKLADTRVLAPFGGVVARRGVEPGEQAGPGMPVFTIVRVDPVQVRVGVPEAEIARVAVGQGATVTVPALGGLPLEGRVRLVGVAADPASRTYTVKVEVANPDRTLRPGMIAEVRIETD